VYAPATVGTHKKCTAEIVAEAAAGAITKQSVAGAFAGDTNAVTGFRVRMVTGNLRAARSR